MLLKQRGKMRKFELTVMTKVVLKLNMGEQWHSNYFSSIFPCAASALKSQPSILEARFVYHLLTDELLGLFFQLLFCSFFLLSMLLPRG